MNYEIRKTGDKTGEIVRTDSPMMSEELSRAWRPELEGWSDDILPFYKAIAGELPNPCTVVEVGAAHGRSAIFLAQQLAARGHGSHTKIFMVDAWGGGWFAKCLPSLVKHARPEELELLCPLRCTSLQAASLFAGELSYGRPHMVFIDADHSRIGCAIDLAAWWPLCREMTILAGHDYDEEQHPGVVQAVDASARARGIEVQRPTRSVWRLQ